MHSVKKFHRNAESDKDVAAAAVIADTDSVSAKDEFWDYEKQVFRYAFLFSPFLQNCCLSEQSFP